MKLTDYPKVVTLRDGTKVTLRYLKREDGPALLEFFRGLPEEDRLFLRDDVTKPEFMESFIEKIDYDTMVPICAEHNGTIVGNATLYRTRHGWTVHVAQIRVVVARTFQRNGLGTELARGLARISINMGLDKMIAQVVDNQVAAQRAFEKLGFHKEAVLKNHVKDIFGRRHDLIIMSNDVSHIWEAMESMAASYLPAME
jgi:RimJ/RimL family protein N-acetyltransferase